MSASTRIRVHIRNNVYGLVAVFIALGGTAYATHPDGENTISTADLQNLAVTSAKIGPQAVSSGKLADDAVRTPKIRDLAVTPEKLQSLAVKASKIGGMAVRTGKLADEAVTAAKLAPDAIAQDTPLAQCGGGDCTTKIGPNAIGRDELGIRAVWTLNLNENAVTASKILDGAVTDAELAADAIPADGTPPNDGSTKIAQGAVGAQEITASAVGAGEIATGAVGASEIGAGAVTSAKLADTGVGKMTKSNTVPGIGTFNESCEDTFFPNLTFTNSSGETVSFLWTGLNGDGTWEPIRNFPMNDGETNPVSIAPSAGERLLHIWVRGHTTGRRLRATYVTVVSNPCTIERFDVSYIK